MWLAINCEGLQRRKLRTGGSIESIQPHLVIYYHGCAQKWNITIGMESLVIFTHNPQKSTEYVSPSTQNETEFSLRIFCECSFGCLVFFLIILLIFWVCWVLIAIQQLLQLGVILLLLWWLLLLQSMGSRHTGFGSCRVWAPQLWPTGLVATCGNFPDQGSNLCSWNWQADSQPLDHQGCPKYRF